MRKLLRSAACALALAAPTAAPAAVVTLHATGQATFGLDQTGVFGSVGDLSGRALDLAVRYDTALAPPGVDGLFWSPATSWLSLELSLDGETFAFADDPAASYLTSIELIENGALDLFNVVFQASGPIAGAQGAVVDLAQSVSLTLIGDLFASRAQLPQFSGPLAATGAGGFSIDDLVCEAAGCSSLRRADGGLEITSATAQTTVGAAVPEPESWTLLVLAFATAGAILRSRGRPSSEGASRHRADLPEREPAAPVGRVPAGGVAGR